MMLDADGTEPMNTEPQHDPIAQIVSEATDATAAAMDEYLLGIFGTREDAARFAHLYVLEVEQTKVEALTEVGRGEDSFQVRASTRYRLRPKTTEELEADGHAENYIGVIRRENMTE